MPCQGFCQAHQPVPNHEFDFSYLETPSYDFWPCDSEKRYLETLENGFADPFDTTTHQTSSWVGSEINDSLTCSTEDPKVLTPNLPQPIENRSVATEASCRDTETRQLVANLEEKVEKLEKLVENLQDESKSESEKLCSEVEKHAKKVENWTAELWQRVVSLVEERKSN